MRIRCTSIRIPIQEVFHHADGSVGIRIHITYCTVTKVAESKPFGAEA